MRIRYAGTHRGRDGARNGAPVETAGAPPVKVLDRRTAPMG